MISINKNNSSFLVARFVGDESSGLYGWDYVLKRKSHMESLRYIGIGSAKTKAIARLSVAWNGKVNLISEAAKKLNVSRSELRKFLQDLIKAPVKPQENQPLELQDFPDHILTFPCTLHKRGEGQEGRVFVLQNGSVIGGFSISQDGLENRRALEKTCGEHGINFPLVWDVIQRRRARVA